MGAAVVGNQGKSYVLVQASQEMVSSGERFQVDVYAVAAEPVNAVDISLQFPRDKVEVTGIDRGQSVITLWTEEPKVVGDRVEMSGGTYRRGFKGKHLIATINFRALNTGVADIGVGNIQFLKGDGSGNVVETIATDDGEVSMYVLNENETPGNLAAKVELIVVTDIDGDGKVTLRDISAFMAAWAGDGRIFDFNGDGKMTFKDFGIILADSFFR